VALSGFFLPTASSHIIARYEREWAPGSELPTRIPAHRARWRQMLNPHLVTARGAEIVEPSAQSAARIKRHRRHVSA